MECFVWIEKNNEVFQVWSAFWIGKKRDLPGLQWYGMFCLCRKNNEIFQTWNDLEYCVWIEKNNEIFEGWNTVFG